MTVFVPRGRRSVQALALGAGAAALCLTLVCPAPAQEPPSTPGPAAAEADGPLVEAVLIQQNRYVPRDTLLYYVSTKPGDRFDERRLRSDFRRLWETGFLEDLLLDIRDGRQGKIITFVVRERRRIMIVDFRGSKALTKTSIEDKLKEKEAAIKLDTFYDVGKLRRVEDIIREMLLEAGLAFGTVRHEAKPVGGAGVQVSVIIDDGPKTRIKEIVFLGNQVYSDGRLRGSMKKLRERRFWNLSWLLGGTTFTEEKWREAQELTGDHYRNRGYVTATVGEPVSSYFDGLCGLFKKRPCKFMRLEIPVSEGEQYRVGEFKIEGLTVFREDAVRRMIRLKPGQIYKWSRLKKTYDKMRDWYGAQGYFNWTPQTVPNADPERRVVDVTIKMEEDKRYYVGRISFIGNESTRDKVVRREIYLDEGGIFNTEALKLSIKRINQLGYFKPIEGAPDLSASALGEDRVDVTFKVEEQNRNQFTVGGGVSGYEGAFLNSSFSTSNFLGMGETFQVSAQSGKRVTNYQIALTEPYFLDRPVTAGIDIYHRKNILQSYGSVEGYADQRTGGSLTSGYPLGRFTRIYGSYTYEVVRVSKVDTSDLYYSYGTGLDGGLGMSGNYLAAYYEDELGRRRESRLTPSLVRNTVDSPYQPRSGSRLTGAVELTGGPLGGTLNFVRPNVEAIIYLPHTKKTALGLRGQFGMIQPFGTTADLLPPKEGSTYLRDALPFYHRFALGGENQVRGYPYYSIYPGQTDDGTKVIRGDKFVVFNAEYYLDVYGPLRALAFFDAGYAYRRAEPINLRKCKVSYGAEVRFTMPVLNVPFRLIYAINPNLDEIHKNSWQVREREIKFSVGTTF